MAQRGRPKNDETRPGRPRKYTAAALRAAADAYFRSITTMTPISDALGENILDIDGNPIVKTVYVIPPTISGLCLKLGIDRRTWQNYADPEKNGGKPGRPSAHSRVCDDVKLKIEAYLNEQLLLREKSVQGIIFNLSNNFGWSEKHEHSQKVELGEETRRALKQDLTMDERFAVIREAAAEITVNMEPEDEEDEDAGKAGSGA